MFPVLAKYSDCFQPNGCAGINPVWAADALALAENKRLASVLPFESNSTASKLQLMASGVAGLEHDGEYEDILLANLPATKPGSSGAPLVVLGLDDPQAASVVGYMLGKYDEDSNTASINSTSTSASEDRPDRVFLSYKAMFKVLAELQRRLFKEGHPNSSAEALDRIKQQLQACAISMDSVRAVRVTPYTPRGRNCDCTAEATMCDMLIDAFDFSKVNSNNRKKLYHAGNIGKDVEVPFCIKFLAC